MKEETKWQKIGDLEWSRYFDKMNWHDAMRMCKELGGRLPTQEELMNLAHKHWEEIKNWANYYFWSSTEVGCGSIYAWRVYLYSGTTNYYTKTNLYYVRCVRRIIL